MCDGAFTSLSGFWMIDAARYWIGVLLVVSLPAALPYWFLIHAWPSFWRRLGKWPTLGAQSALIAVLIFCAIQMLGTLVGRDLGFSPVTAALGLAIYVPTVGISLARGRHLKFAMLLGLPEIAPDQHRPRLLDQGIYARVRHPRYVEVILGISAWALFSNHLGVYLVVAGCIVAVLLIIPLEERELLDRFGPAYEQYRRDVPMLIPRRRS